MGIIVHGYGLHRYFYVGSRHEKVAIEKMNEQKCIGNTELSSKTNLRLVLKTLSRHSSESTQSYQIRKKNLYSALLLVATEN